jgi:sulfide:quinone oxidoreductase
MQLTPLSATLSASPQLQLSELRLLRDAGVRSIICNRPDGEDANQPTFEQIEQAARDLGMQARALPVVASMIGAKDGAAFAALLAQLPAPTVAYCRSGKRSAALWTLARRLRPETETINISGEKNDN